jgi:hypothetical protein
MTDRREEFIAANADFFAARNCHIRFVPIGFAKTEEARSYLPIPQRNALLQRAKILLNVHYSQLTIFRMAPSDNRSGEPLLFNYRNLPGIRAACARQTLCDGKSRQSDRVL